LDVGVINLIDSTELVSGETSVTVCVAVRRAEIAGKLIQKQKVREKVRERKERQKINAR
jgi:hypothetical protein